jgi:trimethylamine:corrinoid methyltransferase-like protein
MHWNPKRCSGIDVFSMMSPGRPELINRLGYEKWEASGRTSLLQRAQQKLQQILQEHQPVPIPAEKARLIRKRVDQFRD